MFGNAQDTAEIKIGDVVMGRYAEIGDGVVKGIIPCPDCDAELAQVEFSEDGDVYLNEYHVEYLAHVQ